MKNRDFAKKTNTTQTDRQPTQIAGSKGVALAPPAYGLDVVDQPDVTTTANSANLIIQPKLIVGQPNDKYEQEANQMMTNINDITADASRSTPPSFKMGQQSPSANGQSISPAPLIPNIQRINGPNSFTAPPNVEAGIKQAQGGGQPLSKSIQNSMEKGFAADFSQVRVHTSNKAHNLNQAIQAKAFTHGQDIFFRQGEYNPHTNSGKAIIAHELTHTIQQGAIQTCQSTQNTGTQSKQRSEPNQTIQSINNQPNTYVQRIQQQGGGVGNVRIAMGFWGHGAHPNVNILRSTGFASCIGLVMWHQASQHGLLAHFWWGDVTNPAHTPGRDEGWNRILDYAYDNIAQGGWRAHIFKGIPPMEAPAAQHSDTRLDALWNDVNVPGLINARRADPTQGVSLNTQTGALTWDRGPQRPQRVVRERRYT